MRTLLDPKAIAVVGASQQPGRGTSVVANLRDERLRPVGERAAGHGRLPRHRDSGTCPRRLIAYSGWMPAALMMAP
jgi:acyl-CoA synthetase (NDP forming)